MKKLFVIFLSLILVFSLMTGCGNGDDKSQTGEAKDTITIVINAC